MSGGLSGRAASVVVTGLDLQLNGVGLGVMASVHGEVTARAQRRQRARSAPCGSRRERQRVRGSGRPRGGLRWFGRRWVESSAPCLPLASAKPPPASVTGRRISCCSSPTPARCQALVRCRGQGGGDGEQGANAALSRSTTCSEENDSRSLNCISETLNLTLTMLCRCSTE